MKVPPQVRLLLLASLVSAVSARCSFRGQEGAEESPMNPHRTRKLGNGNSGNGGNGNGGDPPGSNGNGQGGGGGSDDDFPLTAVRSISGRETTGAAFATLVRQSAADYPDGGIGHVMQETPNARAVSNACLWDDGQGGTTAGASDMLWQFGQFLDHDMDLTEGDAAAGTSSIACPPADSLCGSHGFMEFTRSAFAWDEAGTRAPLNFITALIDGSNVYGSDDDRARALRTLQDGKLRTSAGNLLPFNTQGWENAGGTGDHLFLAGDIRANEQLGLLAMVSACISLSRLMMYLYMDKPRLTHVSHKSNP